MNTYSSIAGNVDIKMSYGLIKHFSEHLYKSPNKAIEEIVVNGYDAGASWVDTYLNGEYGKNRILIWDNGESMDIEGLNKLWEIASSPKRQMTERVIDVGGQERKIIGKFGIGKLASYTLGDKIRHLCRKENNFLLVEVDYGGLIGNGENDEDKINKYSTPIFRLSEDEALEYIRTSFNREPKNLIERFAENTWTFVTIGELKEINITFGRLRWVLQSGMPISPTFSLSIDEHNLVPNLKKNNIKVDWDFSANEIKNYINKHWKEKRDSRIVEGEIDFGKSKGLSIFEPEQEIPYALFPNLGIVHGHIRLYDKSMLNVRDNEGDGRLFGYFVYVRNRGSIQKSVSLVKK